MFLIPVLLETENASTYSMMNTAKQTDRPTHQEEIGSQEIPD
jgi:hypothetical protein